MDSPLRARCSCEVLSLSDILRPLWMGEHCGPFHAIGDILGNGICTVLTNTTCMSLYSLLDCRALVQMASSSILGHTIGFPIRRAPEGLIKDVRPHRPHGERLGAPSGTTERGHGNGEGERLTVSVTEVR